MDSGPIQGVAVRRATTDDVEFLVQLLLLVHLQRHPQTEEARVAVLVQGSRKATLEQVQGKVADSTTNVIEFEGERVGRLRVVRPAQQIEIAGLQLLPAYQQRGIGTAVITTLLHEGREKSLPVVLQVEKDNPEARRLYLRLGFEPYGETHDAFLMIARDASQG